MAPELVQLSAHQVDALAAQAQRLGPAGARAGDRAPRRRSSPSCATPPIRGCWSRSRWCSWRRRRRPRRGDDIAPLAARVAALEQALAEGRVPAPAAAAPVDPATGRTQLGGRAKRAAADPTGPLARPDLRRAADPRPARVVPAPAVAASRPPTPDGDLEAVWAQVKPTLRGMARAVFTPVDVVASTGDSITLAAPNATHLGQVPRARRRRRAGLRRRGRAGRSRSS